MIAATFSCGHERTPANTNHYKGGKYTRCRICLEAAKRRYRLRVKLYGGDLSGHRLSTGRPADSEKNDRLYVLDMPTRRPVWDSAEWWAQRASALAARTCGKQSAHGVARVAYSVTSAGRDLRYQCDVCGWDETVLVQDGASAPCAPVRELAVSRHAYQKSPEHVAKAAAARRQSLATKGLRKQKAWWEDA